jgi:hypothetical protein
MDKPKLKLTQEDFVNRAKEVHGDKYDYSKSVYAGSGQSVFVNCPTHGEFKVVASDLWGGHGCRKCYDESQKTWTEEQDSFVLQNYQEHGSRYCAEKLGKTISAVVSRAYGIGAAKKGIHKKPYKTIPNSRWKSVLRGALARGLAFEITEKDVWDQYIKQGKRCALTGWKVTFRLKGKTTASVDRIDSSKGYTKDNIQILHSAVNRCKIDNKESWFYFMCRDIHNTRRASFERWDKPQEDILNDTIVENRYIPMRNSDFSESALFSDT